MIRALLVACLSLSLLWPVAGQAEGTATPQVPAEVRADVMELAGLMDLAGTVAVMRKEGMAHGLTLNTDLMGGRGGAGWDAAVSGIYDAAAMERAFLDRLTVELAGKPMGEMLAFFQSDLGRQVVALELSAREAMVDPAIEDMADEMRDRLAKEGGARQEALVAFIAENDLEEQNVAGAMNANYAFYSALVAGGGVPGASSQQEILADVWSQEADIRADTKGWLMSYLGMAYQPLSDADLAAYAAFLRSDAGQELNRAMFAAFDAMFVGVSAEMGAAVAQVMTAQEL